MNFWETNLEDPIRLAQIKRWFYRGLAIIVVSEALLLLVQHVFNSRVHDQHHHQFWFENIPAWGSLYGFVSCVAIIVVSKFLGKVWLMRREDYYDS